jgi:hypothetical protein
MKTETQNTNHNLESMFVDFINNNSEKVKAIAAIMAMSDQEKMELIKEFKASR